MEKTGEMNLYLYVDGRGRHRLVQGTNRVRRP